MRRAAFMRHCPISSEDRVAHVEAHALRTRVPRREARHVGRRRAAEPVDGLPRIAEHPERVAGHRAEQARARYVHVLVLVHEHVRMAPSDLCAGLPVRLEEQQRAHHEVAEVDGAAPRELGLVAPVDQRHLEARRSGLPLCGRFRALGHPLGERAVLPRRKDRVLGARDRVEHVLEDERRPPRVLVVDEGQGGHHLRRSSIASASSMNRGSGPSPRRSR
jgi:hypothetical protein